MAHGKAHGRWSDAYWSHRGSKAKKLANQNNEDAYNASESGPDSVTFERGSGHARINAALHTCDYGLKKVDRFDVASRLRHGLASIRKKLEDKYVEQCGSFPNCLSMGIRGDSAAEEDEGDLCMCISTAGCAPSIFHEAVELFKSVEAKIYSEFDEWLLKHGWPALGLHPNDFSYEPYDPYGCSSRSIDPKEASAWEALVQFKKEVRHLKISMNGQGLTNESAERWCRWFRKSFDKMLGSRDREPIVAKRVDFSSNHLGAVGIEKVLQTLTSRNIVTTVLMMHHNQLQDGSAVANYISFCGGMMQELHLSHNHLEAAGAADIVVAAAKLRSAYGSANRPCYAYPRYHETSGAMVPLWLRMEQNFIDHSKLQEIMRPTIKRLKGRGEVLCSASGSRCTPQTCGKAFDQPPAVHAKNLGGQGNQRSGNPPVRSSPPVAPAEEDAKQKTSPSKDGGPKDDDTDVVASLAAIGAPIGKWRVKSAPQDTEQQKESEEEGEGDAATPRGKTMQPVEELTPKSPSVQLTLADVVTDGAKDGVADTSDVQPEFDNVVEAIRSGERYFRPWLQQSLRSREDHEQIKSVLIAIETAIKEGLENCDNWKVKPFGSVVAGFGTKNCDLDAVVYQEEKINGSGSVKSELEVKTILLKLAQLLGDCGFLVKEQILCARVPVLKLQYEDLEVDLSFNNTNPLRNTRLLRAYAALDPLVAELVVAIKLWAKHKRICGAVGGHLSSYAFAMMVIFYLQVVSGINMPCLQSWRRDTSNAFSDDEAADKLAQDVRDSGWKLEGSLFMLFCGFFAFYAGTPGPGKQFYDAAFNWSEEVVSVRLGRRKFSSDDEFRELRGRNEMQLHIEDPFERSRNLRDVMSRETERILYEQITWMDTECRRISMVAAASPILEPTHPPFSPDMLPFGMPWFPHSGWPPMPMMPPMDMLPEGDLSEKEMHSRPPGNLFASKPEKGKAEKGKGEKGKGEKGKADKGKAEKGKAEKGKAEKGKAEKGKKGKGKGGKGSKWIS